MMQDDRIVPHNIEFDRMYDDRIVPHNIEFDRMYDDRIVLHNIEFNRMYDDRIVPHNIEFDRMHDDCPHNSMANKTSQATRLSDNTSFASPWAFLRARYEYEPCRGYVPNFDNFVKGRFSVLRLTNSSQHELLQRFPPVKNPSKILKETMRMLKSANVSAYRCEIMQNLRRVILQHRYLLVPPPASDIIPDIVETISIEFANWNFRVAVHAIHVITDLIVTIPTLLNVEVLTQIATRLLDALIKCFTVKRLYDFENPVKREVSVCMRELVKHTTLNTLTEALKISCGLNSSQMGTTQELYRTQVVLRLGERWIGDYDENIRQRAKEVIVNLVQSAKFHYCLQMFMLSNDCYLAHKLWKLMQHGERVLKDKQNVSQYGWCVQVEENGCDEDFISSRSPTPLSTPTPGGSRNGSVISVENENDNSVDNGSEVLENTAENEEQEEVKAEKEENGENNEQEEANAQEMVLQSSGLLNIPDN